MGPAEIYKLTRKRPDLVWNTYVARPPAAVVVAALQNTRVTPNQITLSALGVAAVSAAMIVLAPGYAGLVAAVVVYELSYVLDCADGMLARLRKTASTTGHLLDFLMDEIKAFVILGAVGVRLYRGAGHALWLGAGDANILLLTIAGLVCLASGIALTTFQRRPEVAGQPADTKPAPPAPTRSAVPVGASVPPAPPLASLARSPRSLVKLALRLFERTAKLLIHYPSYILLVALAGHLELYFYPYIAVNALYVLSALAQVTLKFGRA